MYRTTIQFGASARLAIRLDSEVHIASDRALSDDEVGTFSNMKVVLIHKGEVQCEATTQDRIGALQTLLSKTKEIRERDAIYRTNLERVVKVWIDAHKPRERRIAWDD